MNLPDFIDSHMEAILAEWEVFARSLGETTQRMSVESLRDHAQRMLHVIVATMRAEPVAPTSGLRVADAASPASAHGKGRHEDGFSLLELTAEFRALRASVLRLWLPTITATDARSVDEMIRFNDALDQAIAESVAIFTTRTDAARDVFLAMLGHDLRSPLAAIGMTAEYFERDTSENARRITSARRIRRSVASMSRMVDDLLEFSRLQLGGRIPIVRTSDDLGEICQRAVDDARVAHPACVFELRGATSTEGEFDADRLGQVFGNLLNNAFQYRARGSTVTMEIVEDGSEIGVSVHNHGPAIARAHQALMFHPMVQLTDIEHDIDRPRSSMGLGLFIARHLVEAHGGRLTVESTDAAGTTFLVRLPR